VTQTNNHPVIDLTTIYPPSWLAHLPSISATFLSYQATHYQDLFFTSPPRWFTFYVCMEALIHIPISIWSLRALWNDDPKVPLVLLCYGIQTSITTATCMVEYTTWDISTPAKWDLTTLYGPYLAVAAVMAGDMFIRLSRVIGDRTRATGKKTL
jgi:hypothetical protein